MHRAFGADIHAIAALDVARHFAHDHNFAGLNAGVDLAIAADGDSAFGHGDFAFNAAVDVQRLGAADFALDEQRAANGGLIHGSGNGFNGSVCVGVGSRRSGLRVQRVIRRLKHVTFLGSPRGARSAKRLTPGSCGCSKFCGLRQLLA